MKRFLSPLAVLLVLAVNSIAAAAEMPAPPATPEPPKIDGGDTAWMLISAALVMLMVPGLALFYGGMVRRKNVLGTMMHSMVALAIIGVQWIVFGYALAFGNTQGGWIGWSPDLLGLQGILEVARDGTLTHKLFPGTHIPILVHCIYQGMFAIITPALISGAFAERIKFGPYCLFILLWAALVYDPLAHWVWAVKLAPTATDPYAVEPAGWLGAMGALDFAGGTVVHIAAGISGLAAILVLRKRIGYPEHAMHPNSMVLTLTGAGLLWFGWFGFNGGSALGSNGLAGAALAATQVAAAGAALSWLLAEWMHRGKPTGLGLATGLVAGLVAVTPASGFVTPMGALSIGLLAGVVCYGSVCLKPILKYDDSLDAFGVHGVGGFLGAVLTGIFVSGTLYKAGSGSELPPVSFFGSSTTPRVVVQLVAALVSVVYAFAVTLVLIKGIDLVWGFCLDPRAEDEGLDRAQHGEVGFDLGLALETVPEHLPVEPRAATVPPNGHKRFTVVIEGADNSKLIQTWSGLCQIRDQPPSAEFKQVYPYLTTVQGNRFRFRGGDPDKLRASLQQIFQNELRGAPIEAHVEG